MGVRPNIVFIVTDTFRRDHLGLYGNSWIHTPNLDRFAAQSTVFESHHASSFPTMPARVDFTTGRFGATFMGWEPLPSELPTLAATLSAEGYVTMGIVDTPFFVRDGYGYDRGFEDFMWLRGQGDHSRPLERSDYRSTWRSENDSCVARTFGEAELWLERNHNNPFFLYIDTWDPHEPWDAPDFYTKLYLPEFDGTEVYPPYGRPAELGLDERAVEIAHATYCGEVTLVDRWFGSLMEKLRVLGLADNTYVVFTSDHGFYFGEHDCLGKGYFASDGKGWVAEGAESYGPLGDVAGAPSWSRSPLYQELIHLPLIVRGPGVDARRVNPLTSGFDIVPTIADLADVGGLDTPQHGRSFRSCVNGGGQEHRDIALSAWPLYLKGGSMTKAVDSKPRRILEGMPVTISSPQYRVLVGGEQPPELYDRAGGSSETQNIWAEHPELGEDIVGRGLELLDGLGVEESLIDSLRLPGSVQSSKS